MIDSPAMRTGTSLTGPLGSSIHVIRADATTIAELAAIDWNRYFRRVCLDPVRGLITLMSPSHPHEDLATVLDNVVDAAGSVLAGATKGLRSLRLRAPAAHHAAATASSDAAVAIALARRSPIPRTPRSPSAPGRG